MSTDNQYTPDELKFIDNALVGIANAYLSDSDAPASWPEFVRRDALALLEARRKIVRMAQPTQTAPIANDELVAHGLVRGENMIRGVVILDSAAIGFNGSTMGFESIPKHFGLAPGDIVEIRVIERADR